MTRLFSALLLLPGLVLAADHAEAPGAADDPAADLADLYVWHQNYNLVAVMNFAGYTPAGSPAVYDPDVLYTLHIDKDGDLAPDAEIHFRFGQNEAGDWGVQVTDLPGATEAQTVGPVGEVIEAGGAKVYAGLRDDPFFFDQAGYLDTLATGDLSFTGADAVAGLNVTTLVVEFPYTGVVNTSGATHIWATTSRLEG